MLILYILVISFYSGTRRDRCSTTVPAELKPCFALVADVGLVATIAEERNHWSVACLLKTVQTVAKSSCFPTLLPIGKTPQDSYLHHTWRRTSLPMTLPCCRHPRKQSSHRGALSPVITFPPISPLAHTWTVQCHMALGTSSSTLFFTNATGLLCHRFFWHYRSFNFCVLCFAVLDSL